MRVLIYTPRAFSGSESFIRRLSNIQWNGLKKHLVCNYKIGEVDSDSFDSITVIPSKPESTRDRIISFLQRKINHIQTDYVVSSMAIKKIKSLIYRHRIQFLHLHYGPSSIALYPLLKSLKIPFIVHFHGYDASKELKNKLYLNGLKKVFELNPHAIVVSNEMKLNLVRHGFNRENFSIIPYGVDLQEFKQKKSRGIQNNLIKILHIGRLVNKKGVPDLVEVFAKINKLYENVELIIGGEGEEYELVHRLIENHKLNSKVKLLGALSSEKVVQLMESADIFVLNSRTSIYGDKEGFPNVIIEAMAMGCAVVSTRHAGIPEAIDHGINGLLVEEKSNDQLFTNISRLIENPDLREKLGREAIKKVNTLFSIEEMHNKIHQLYYNING